ncbi:MAG: hypothetical protein WCA49_14095, partial [Candidatus Sulfotelmatobacter sp.]
TRLRSTREQKYRRKWARGPKGSQAAAKVGKESSQETAEGHEEISETAEECGQAVATPRQIAFRVFTIEVSESLPQPKRPEPAH